MKREVLFFVASRPFWRQNGEETFTVKSLVVVSAVPVRQFSSAVIHRTRFEVNKTRKSFPDDSKSVRSIYLKTGCWCYLFSWVEIWGMNRQQDEDRSLSFSEITSYWLKCLHAEHSHRFRMDETRVLDATAACSDCMREKWAAFSTSNDK